MKKITQAIIAQKLGLSQGLVSKIMRGGSFSRQTAMKIAAYTSYPQWHELLVMPADEIRLLITRSITESEQ